MEKYHELLAAAAKFSPTFPATNSPTWHQQLDGEALYGILGTNNFAHSVQAIGKPGDEARDMGEYLPRGRYLTTSAFETAIPSLTLMASLNRPEI